MGNDHSTSRCGWEARTRNMEKGIRVSDNNVWATRVLEGALMIAAMTIYGAIYDYDLNNPSANVPYVTTTNHLIEVNGTIFAYLGNGVSVAATFPAWSVSNFGQFVTAEYPPQLNPTCVTSPNNDIAFPIFTTVFQLIGNRVVPDDVYYYHGIALRIVFVSSVFALMAWSTLAFAASWVHARDGMPIYHWPMHHLGIHAFSLIRGMFIKIVSTVMLAIIIGVDIDTTLGLYCVVAVLARIYWAMVDHMVFMAAEPPMSSIDVPAAGEISRYGHSMTLNVTRLTWLGAIVVELGLTFTLIFRAVGWFVNIPTIDHILGGFVDSPQNTQRWLVIGLTLGMSTWKACTRTSLIYYAWLRNRPVKNQPLRFIVDFDIENFFGSYQSYLGFADLVEGWT